MASLTTGFITRNHAPSIGRAITSVIALGGSVLVLDTGSTDATPAIAKELGATVVPFAWENDFAAAMNHLVQMVETDWLFSLNPDEALNINYVGTLLAVLPIADVFAARVRVRPEFHADGQHSGSEETPIRLFRPTPDLRYRGRLYPRAETAFETLAQQRNQEVASLDVLVHRYAYLSPTTPEKLRWVVGLLEAELRDRPNQPDYQLELGRHLLWLNDPRGHDYLAQLDAHLLAHADDPAPPSTALAPLFEYLLTVSAAQSRSQLPREQVRTLAARWFPFAPPVVWAHATERYIAGDYVGATDLLQSLLKMGQSGLYSRAAPFSLDILGVSALLNLGLCHLHRSQWQAAETCFAPFVNHPQHAGRAREGLTMAHGRKKPT